MRSGAFDPGSSSVDVEVHVGGSRDTPLAEYRLRNSIASDYDKSFPAIVKKAIDNYRSRERAWQTPNTCAELEFDPANFKKQLKRGESGRFTGKVKAKEGGGTAKEAKWKRTGQSNATITPAETKGGSATLNYSRVVKEGPDVTAKYKVTSTAGVAEDTWKQHTSPVIYYKITGLVYTDSLTYDGIPPILGCTQSSGQNNVATLEPSGTPTDGALGPDLAGNSTGLLLAKATVQKNVAYSGCKYNDTATAMVPCNLTNSGSEPSFPLAVEMNAPAGDGPVTLSWHPHGLSIGDVTPQISPCFPATTQVPDAALTATTTVPRSTMTDAGSHTISLDLPQTVPAAGGNGTVHSTAHYAITFMRVNEDGSPYS